MAARKAISTLEDTWWPQMREKGRGTMCERLLCNAWKRRNERSDSSRSSELRIELFDDREEAQITAHRKCPHTFLQRSSLEEAGSLFWA